MASVLTLFWVTVALHVRLHKLARRENARGLALLVRQMVSKKGGATGCKPWVLFY